MRMTKLLAMVLFASVMVAPQALAQAVCRPADSLGSRFLAHIARHSVPTNPTDAMVRDSLRLGAVSSRSQVVMFTQGVQEGEGGLRGWVDSTGRIGLLRSGLCRQVRLDLRRARS
jgi:hypothetical protein